LDKTTGFRGNFGGYFDIIKIYETTNIIRILRLFTYLTEIKTVRIIVETLKNLVLPFYSLITVQFIIFYFFALIGMAIFGGEIVESAYQIKFNDLTPDLFFLLNFNDLGASYITLFSIMLETEWDQISAMLVRLSSRWIQLYFFAFYFTCIIIGLNLIVAFAIDMHCSIEKLDRQQQEHEDKLFLLAKKVKETGKETNEIMLT
jgi:voltage-gated sodium channel